MPKVGVEPTLPKEHEFESCASAYSATSASGPKVYFNWSTLSTGYSSAAFMDEEGLIRSAQRGDVNSYNDLVLFYQDMAFNVAYRIMSEPGTAADITQEAFIAAYKSLNKFQGGNFKAWLLRIVTNRCYDELRRRKRRPQSSLDELTEENDSWGALADEDAHNPEEEQDKRELVQAIQRCMEELPEEQRVATILCDVEGYDYNAIADMMQVSLGTVKSRMSRARSKLRDCLQSFGELLPLAYR